VLRQVEAGSLRVAYEEAGEPDGRPVFLLHGFPYDPRCYDAASAILAGAGCRVIVPYLRGYGPTRFLSPATPRSGQQAAIAADLLALMDALGIARAVLAGFDWGGRAACIAAALWPERVAGLQSCEGYTIQNIAAAGRPSAPEAEHRNWYQYYFHGERGRAGLAAHRRELTRLLWQLWSPQWQFDEATLERTVVSFDNPDFVDVVVHSYRHRYGLVPGDPALEEIELRLAALPAIGVPTQVLHGEADGVGPVGDSAEHQRRFTGPYLRRTLPGIGHNVPQEAPEALSDAVLRLAGCK